MITKKDPEPEPGEYIKKEGKRFIERALTILRLYKEEVIGYNVIVQSLNGAYSLLPLKHYQLWMNPETDFSSLTFKIISTEIDKLKGFFSKFICTSEAFKELELAVKYFNKSYIEPYTPRDSSLDLMISLENLYLPGEKHELGYKLRMRMAHILAKELAQRKEILEDIKLAYNYRGEIVHGGKSSKTISKIKEKHKNESEFLFKIRGYTRESLKIFIKNPALRNKLDEIILQ